VRAGALPAGRGAGYADQSHLIREFRTFVRTTRTTTFLAQVRGTM